MAFPIVISRVASRAYSRSITIDNTGNATTLTEYQVKIDLTSSNFDFSKAASNGADIRILDSGVLIPFYIRSYDNIGQTAEIWARVPSIPGSGTKTLLLTTANSTSPFTVPPTGKFTRPSSSVASGLAENMVYDSVTNKYYVVTSSTTIGPVKLYSSSSPSGPWTDEGTILNLGAGGTWDDTAVYAPHLIKDGSTWYLFYSGGPDGTEDSHSVGYATASSITGPYTRYASNPVLTYTGTATFDRYRACEPFVFYSSILSQWVMLYMGDSGSGTASQIEKLGYATASAITGPWTKYASNPVVSPVSGPDWRDTNIIADPFAVEIDGVAYIFLTGGKEGYAWSIGCFKTSDYITFTEIGQVYGSGVATTYDGAGVLRGAILRVADTYYLPFAGFNGVATFGWAVATMSALSTAKGFDPLQVFDYFDDFSGAALDDHLWASPSGSTSGTITVSGGILTLAITSGSSVHRTLAGHREFGVGYMIEAYTRQSTATATSTNAGEVGLADETDRQPASRIYQYDTAFARKENVSNAGASSLSNMTQALTTGWVKRSIAFISASSIGFRNDSNAWETVGTNVADRVLKPWIFAFRGSANISYEIDWVIVRKYANPEPSISVS